MARRSKEKSLKRQKEIGRMQKAKDKMARRQGKKEKPEETETSTIPDESQDSQENEDHVFTGSRREEGESTYCSTDQPGCPQ